MDLHLVSTLSWALQQTHNKHFAESRNCNSHTKTLKLNHRSQASFITPHAFQNTLYSTHYPSRDSPNTHHMLQCGSQREGKRQWDSRRNTAHLSCNNIQVQGCRSWGKSEDNQHQLWTTIRTALLNTPIKALALGVTSAVVNVLILWSNTGALEGKKRVCPKGHWLLTAFRADLAFTFYPDCADSGALVYHVLSILTCLSNNPHTHCSVWLIWDPSSLYPEGNIFQ